jgi:hypothetical protein
LWEVDRSAQDELGLQIHSPPRSQSSSETLNLDEMDGTVKAELQTGTAPSASDRMRLDKQIYQ